MRYDFEEEARPPASAEGSIFYIDPDRIAFRRSRVQRYPEGYLINQYAFYGADKILSSDPLWLRYFYIKHGL